jgi:hypothetical protein
MYVRESEARAFISPAYDISSLQGYQVQELLLHSMTMTEWTALFSSIKEDSLPSWLIQASNEDEKENISSSVHNSVTLMTPKSIENLGASSTNSSKKAGLILTIPMLSFDFDEAVEIEEQVGGGHMSTSYLHNIISTYNKRFFSLKNKWTAAFQEIESNYLIMVSDIKNLEVATNGLDSSVTRPSNIPSEIPSSIWMGINYVYQTVQSGCSTLQHMTQSLQTSQTTMANELKAINSHLSTIPLALDYDSMDDRLTTVEAKTTDYDRKFFQILQFVRKFNGARMNPSFISNNEVDALKDQVLHLQQELRVLCETSSLSTATRSIDEQMRDMKHQLKLLQQRITGNGVQIGTKVFQSFEDVKTWVKTNLPTRRYGLFVDAVSLLDFISASNHSDSDKTFTASHNQQKTGFTSMYEACTAISTQHLFPTIFGRSHSTGMIVNTYRLFRTLPNGTPAAQVYDTKYNRV